MRCTHKSMYLHGLNTTLVCQKITEELLCHEEFAFVNLMNLFFCELQANYWIFMPIILFVLFIIFKYVATTVEEYIAGAIQEISNALNMSDSLASITLLAAANGSADMMTVLIASETEGGISYNIGTLYGAGLFICCAVLGICIVTSKKKLRFNYMIIYRLIVFYLLATMLTICFALYKEITWWESSAMLVLYLILIAVVVFDDWRASKTSHLTASMNAGTNMDSSVASEDKDEHQLPTRLNSRIFDQYNRVVDREVREDETNNSIPITMQNATPHRLKSQNMVIPSFVDYKYNEPHSLTQDYRRKIDLAKEIRKSKLKRTGIVGWLNILIERPFMWILWVTVLPCDKEQYSRKRCLAYAFPGMIFAVIGCTKMVDKYTLAIGGGLGLFIFILFFLTLPEKKLPRGFLAINILGLFASVLWTYILINIMVDLIECIGIILNLNKTFLGLTVLAIGSSLPDALTTITLCKQSESIMAISGAYSGQLFALTVAFGISMLKLTITKGPQKFDLFDPFKFWDNSLGILVIFSNFFVLFVTFIYAIRKRYRLETSFGYGLLTIYILFLIGATVIGVKDAIKTF